jgi:hypothetical protein
VEARAVTLVEVAVAVQLEILQARRCSLRAVVAAVVIMDAQVVPVAAVVD